MLNSRNYFRDANVINTGEEIAPEADLKDPETKIYYHQVKGARTHLSDGAEIVFRGGMFATANPEIKAFLDKIADKRGSMVFTKSVETAINELATAAADAAAKSGDALTAIGTTADADLVKTVANLQTRVAGQVKADLEAGVSSKVSK